MDIEVGEIIGEVMSSTGVRIPVEIRSCVRTGIYKACMFCEASAVLELSNLW